MSNIYDKASLVLIPSGTKTSKVYSQKPVNGDGDFTFSRSTAATRVNADGNIEKETQNLLLQSNNFDTSWNSQGTLTGGQADKDGGTSAWSFTNAGATSGLYQNITTGGVQTFSAYLKKNATNGVRIYMFGTNNASPYFNLNTGSVVSLSNALDATIVEYNSEWWRISVTTSSTLSQVYFYPTNNAGTQVVGTITIQDAQLEQGLVARDYIETTTAAVEGGITDNVPRLDYTDSSCPALLLEPQRTNDVAYSEYFNAWSLSGGTLTANATTSPEGVQNASLYTEDTSTNYHRLNIGAGSGSSKVFSVYAKLADGAVNKWLTIDNGPTAWFDLENGVVGAAAGSVVLSIEDAGSGWYRCIYYNPTSYSSAFYLGIAASNGGAGNHTGSGLPAFYAYGAQGESNVSYATSYIPTYGTSVTRNADAASKTGISSLIGQTEGTLFVDIDLKGTTNSDQIYIEVNDGTASNKIYIGLYGIYSLFRVVLAGSELVNINNTLAVGNRYKMALTYKSNSIKAFINGSKIGEDTSASIPSCSTINLNTNASGQSYAQVNMQESLVFPTTLTDQEAIDLTTI